MGVGMHAACTLLGTAFGMLSCYLAFTLFVGFSWRLLGSTVVTFAIAAEFFHGALTRRYPFWVLIWLLPE